MTDMTCETALDGMLEAGPAELRGQADTGLAAHIADCHRCAVLAAAMLGELEAVDDALAGYATGGPTFATASDLAADAHHGTDRGADSHAAADAATDAALAAIREEGDRDVVSLHHRRRRTVRHGARTDRAPAAAQAPTGRAPSGSSRRWTRAAWIPLAAAAMLAAVLVFGQDDPFSGPGTDATVSPEPTLEPRVAVTPPADKGAVIMETENPNITIVWLYDREGT